MCFSLLFSAPALHHVCFYLNSLVSLSFLLIIVKAAFTEQRGGKKDPLIKLDEMLLLVLLLSVWIDFFLWLLLLKVACIS